MKEFIAIHSFSETQEHCTLCDSTEITKLLTRPLKIEKKSQSAAVGEITKEYIDSNREILNDLKNNSKSENYEPS